MDYNTIEQVNLDITNRVFDFCVNDKVRVINNLTEKYPEWGDFKWLEGVTGTIISISKLSYNITFKIDDINNIKEVPNYIRDRYDHSVCVNVCVNYYILEKINNSKYIEF